MKNSVSRHQMIGYVTFLMKQLPSEDRSWKDLLQNCLNGTIRPGTPEHERIRLDLEEPLTTEDLSLVARHAVRAALSYESQARSYSDELLMVRVLGLFVHKNLITHRHAVELAVEFSHLNAIKKVSDENAEKEWQKICAVVHMIPFKVMNEELIAVRERAMEARFNLAPRQWELLKCEVSDIEERYWNLYTESDLTMTLMDSDVAMVSLFRTHMADLFWHYKTEMTMGANAIRAKAR